MSKDKLSIYWLLQNQRRKLKHLSVATRMSMLCRLIFIKQSTYTPIEIVYTT